MKPAAKDLVCLDGTYGAPIECNQLLSRQLCDPRRIDQLDEGRLPKNRVTIHPYYDGNGRTARLLATFILHKGGYGLGGFFSLEEHYAKDLQGYYRALTVHPHHNYYFGRSEADLTPWLEYFIFTLAEVFEAVRQKVQKFTVEGMEDEPEALRRLDHRARVVLGLFAGKDRITAPQDASELGLSERTARNLLKGWTADRWLEVAAPSRRGRAYSLTAVYRQYIGSLSATAQRSKNRQP